MRWLRGLLVAGTAFGVAVAVGCTPEPADRQPTMSAKPLRYVALGDSVAAAPLVPETAQPTGCLKSTNNYPSVLARRLEATTFVDVTCSGATSDDITNRSQQTRQGAVAPQIDAVTADTDVITVTIGGNDVGLYPAAMQCKRQSLDEPPCADDFVDGPVDRLSADIAAKAPAWAHMIDAIRVRAPRARIVVVGYGTYIRPGGCFPEQPVHPRDADYFQSKIDELNDVFVRLAAEKGIDYFDTRGLSVGHDMCAGPDQRYFEGFVLAHRAAPLHPNLNGSAAVGNALADYLG